MVERVSSRLSVVSPLLAVEILSETSVQGVELLAEDAEMVCGWGKETGLGIISMWPVAGRSTGNRESPAASLEKSSFAQTKA